MITLLVARHGNTFGPDEIPRRVGAHTDLPLVESGRAQAQALGRWIKESGYTPSCAYSSDLVRTKETARLALDAAGLTACPLTALSMFNEIDYGPDENKTEADVIARIGAAAIEAWDKHGIVPDGWNFNPDACIKDWTDFAARLVADTIPCTLAVTSNGIARFAPHITGDFAGFAAAHSLKISTGAVCRFVHDGTKWHVADWNIRPPLFSA